MLNKKKFIFISALFICMIIFISILPLVNESSLVELTDKPFGLHIVYGEDPTREVKIIWLTIYDKCSKVILRTPDCETKVIVGFTKKLENVYLHVVEIRDLEPGNEYLFRIFGYNEEYSFRTLNTSYTSLRIIIAGDSRTGITWRNKISKLIVKYKPEFVLHTGDMLDEGKNFPEWLEWISHQGEYLRDENRIIPVMPTLGNHERNSTYYYELYQVERWYALNFWNLTILSLNSEFGFNEQRRWLDNIKFNSIIIGFWHRTVISSGPHENATEFYRGVVVYLEEKGMILGFQGHNHHYSRSKPIRNGTIHEDGTIYITTGGWGAPLADPDRPLTWAEKYSKE